MKESAKNDIENIWKEFFNLCEAADEFITKYKKENE